ncbi:MAG: DUF523 and DUF1722 domain-containing protein [Methanomicrobiales archaeon]|nr:DUF523 and DUF1722 domain-containing protein [Methanomicrobiales archaeon]
MISSETVKRLRDKAEMYAVCPEVEIGLGIPREPLHLVESQQGTRFIQPATGRDMTAEMSTFADWYLKSLPLLDGFIMKDRSPSCGLKNVPVPPNTGVSESSRRESGLFSREIVKRFPLIPRTDEVDLSNPRLRDHFLTQIFTVAEFRALRHHESTKNLLQFHAENKYLLIAYHRGEYKTLTALATNREERSYDIVMSEYQEHLLKALSKPPRKNSHIAVLDHALNHFAGAMIPGKEREAFTELIETYRKGKHTLSGPRAMLRAWIVTYDEDYLAHQTYFEPYPADLETIPES